MIKEKRWIVAGPWVVEFDTNIPSGESIIRQILYGKKYFKDRFDIDIKIGYNPDSFGHNANLPQILIKTGINCYVFFRPSPEEKDLPQVFFWEGIDGSKIISCRPPFLYATWDDESQVAKNLREIPKFFNDDLKDILFFFGVGNHGGGPTRKSLEIIEELKREKNFPKLEYSSIDRFFKNILKKKRRIPIVKGELQNHARGCYTSFIKIKHLNRYAENKIQTAEIISSLNYLIFKKEYNLKEFEKRWWDILFCQFHDIIAGTSIIEAYEDCLRLIDRAIIFSKETIDENLWFLSKNVNTENEGTPILLFNPTSFEREEVKRVSFNPMQNFIPAKNVDFFDIDGKRILSQPIKEVNSGSNDFLIKVKIPPFGYKVYWWKLTSQNNKNRKNENLLVKDLEMKNQFLIFELIPKEDGFRVKLKKGEWEVFKHIGGRFLVIEDKGNTWGHNIEKWRNVIGNFKLEEILKGEEGECMVSLKCKLVYNKSEIIQEILLYDNLPYIEVRGKIFWKEENKYLKISFPINLFNCAVYAEIPYGYLKRKSDGKEYPFQRWIAVEGIYNEKKYCLGIINTGWYGYDFFDGELRISVLRSPVFSSFKNSYELEKDSFFDFQSQGFSQFRYWILPFCGSLVDSSIVKYAYFLNNEIEYVLPLKSKGILPPTNSFLKIKPENLVISCVKKSEKGNSIILRVYETYGKPTEGEIEIFGKKFKINFSRHEIKTLRFENYIKYVKIKEVNFLERKEKK